MAQGLLQPTILACCCSCVLIATVHTTVYSPPPRPRPTTCPTSRDAPGGVPTFTSSCCARRHLAAPPTSAPKPTGPAPNPRPSRRPRRCVRLHTPSASLRPFWGLAAHPLTPVPKPTLATLPAPDPRPSRPAVGSALAHNASIVATALVSGCAPSITNMEPHTDCARPTSGPPRHGSAHSHTLTTRPAS